jgi:alpha-beta hydrolase superfamily lysophospholipase
MKHIAPLLNVLLPVLLLGGCTAATIVQSGTEDTNKITMELIGSNEHLLNRGMVDAARRFKMSDGVEIDAWAIKSRKKDARPAGTVVVLHGTGQSKANYLGIGANLAKMGYGVVLIDLRCHGRSGGKYITCGAKEKMDVKTVVDAMIKDKVVTAKPLYVLGVTFGGATAIQYAAIEPNVAGVVAFAPWKDTAAKARRDVGLMMSEEEFQKVLADAGKLAEFDPMTTSAVRDAAKLKCPLYLIHGALDMVVPLSDSQAILQAAGGPKKLKVIMPGPEQLAVGIGWETWVPDQVDMVAKGKLNEKKKPAKPPTSNKKPSTPSRIPKPE